MLINFLRTDHGIAFDKLFAMKEYPHDVLPLYSEGYSLARFLIEQGGRQKFMEFVGEGMKSENWPTITKQEYGYANLQALQDQWLDWVKQGSPVLPQRNMGAVAANDRPSRSSEQPLYRAQSDDRESLASNKTARGNESWGNKPSADQGWGPVAKADYPTGNAAQGFKYGPSQPNQEQSDSFANSGRSVYDQRTNVAETSRDDLALASNSSGGQDHHVLLQWTR